jgi:tetratricopeptide (TPR) repeat protein
MRICPFLVAGRSMQAGPAVPVSPASSFATPDLDAILQSSPVVSQDVVPAAGCAPVQLSSAECLGETCRFFHAGGCRFDALFEAQSAPARRAGAGDEAPAAEAGSPAGIDAAMLEEVWSLQRESLRETLGGLRKLESAQAALQAEVASQVETQVDRVAAVVGTVQSQVGQVGAQVGRVESSVDRVASDVAAVPDRVGQVATRVERVDTQVGQVDGRVAQVGTQVGKVDARVAQVESLVAGVESQVKRVASQVSAVEGGVGRVEAELGQVRAQIEQLATRVEAVGQAAAASPELLDLVGRHFETLERDVRQIETGVRTGLGDSLRAAVEESQTAAQKALAATQQAVATSEVGLRAAVEALQAAVRAALQESQSSVRSSITESHTQLGKLVASATNETRAQLERVLTKLLEELGPVREARTHIEGAVDGLLRETREVATLARRVESSQVLTHELLDEQRQVAARVDARERRERARQVNNAGVLSYHQGSYDTSVERFKQATELDPTLSEAFNNLGLSYTEMGRDEEASIAFQRALELDPSAGHVYNNLGYLHYRKGELNTAVEMYQRAIQRGADTSAAYANLANAYYRLKRTEQAVAAWRRALEIDPSNHKAATALERLGLEVRTPSRPV